MAYVLVPPLPRGARKSDYVPVEQLHHKPERSDAVKGKVRAGDNAGSAALAAALQDAFKNNASGSGRTDSPTAKGKRKGRGKQKAVEPSVETVEVVDDEAEDEGAEAEARNQGSATLAHALDAAFAHNSANPNVAAAGQSGSTRHLRRSTRAADFGTVSVEIDVLPPAKRPRGRPRVTTNPDNKKRQPQSPSGPQTKRRRVTRRGDDADAHSSEDEGELEIPDDASTELRRSPRRKPRSKGADPPRPKPRRISQHRRASMPSRVSAPVPTSEPAPSSPPPTPPPQSPPATPPPPQDNNMPSGHPLTILPLPSPTDIVIAPRALSHLPASPDPPDPQSGAQQPGQNRSLQGFHGEEAATGAHGLLESPATAATPMDSSLCAVPIPTTTATTTTNADLHHHHPLDIGLDIVVPTDIGDVEQQQQQERQDPVRTAGVPSHALRISSSTHPDGPMLGFALSEHEDGPGPASLSADADTEASSDGFGLGLGLGANTGPPDMDFMPVSSNSYFNDGIAWGTAGPSTAGVSTGDEYVGDGTIDPSVLGGCPGAGSPCKLFRSDTAESSLRGFAFAHPIDDVTDGDFVPSAVASKGKVTVAGAARTRTVVGGGRIGAGNVRIRTKTWRKALADENDSEDTDTDDAADDDDVEQCLDDVGAAARRQLSTSSNLSPSEASASSLRLQVLRGEEKTFCHHCRCKTRRPKMRCTFIRESTGVQCRKLYCKGCIEKRYVLRFFHLPALTCGLTWGGVC